MYGKPNKRARHCDCPRDEFGGHRSVEAYRTLQAKEVKWVLRAATNARSL